MYLILANKKTGPTTFWFTLITLPCLSDTDYTNRDNRTSVNGQILLLRRSPIFWKSWKQTCIALLNMESKYIALTQAYKELIWIIQVLSKYMNKNFWIKKYNWRISIVVIKYQQNFLSLILRTHSQNILMSTTILLGTWIEGKFK